MEPEKKQETREERRERAMKKISEARPASPEDLERRILGNTILMGYKEYEKYCQHLRSENDSEAENIELHSFLAHYILHKQVFYANIPISITKTKSADTRSATEIVTEEQLLKNSQQHIKDVRQLCGFCAKKFTEIGRNHDYTKIDYIKDFHRDFKATQEGKGDFDFIKDGTWAKMHYACERHHLLRNVPDNVNLFDIMEMIIDNVTAGLARSGKVRDGGEMISDPKLLAIAFLNTVSLFADICEVVDNEKKE